MPSPNLKPLLFNMYHIKISVTADMHDKVSNPKSYICLGIFFKNFILFFNLLNSSIAIFLIKANYTTSVMN